MTTNHTIDLYARFHLAHDQLICRAHGEDTQLRSHPQDILLENILGKGEDVIYHQAVATYPLKDLMRPRYIRHSGYCAPVFTDTWFPDGRLTGQLQSLTDTDHHYRP